MPRQKETESFEGLDEMALDAASPDEQLFALELAKGREASEVYREIYPHKARNWEPQSIWVAASRMRNSAKVALWLNAYRMAGVNCGKRTLGQHIGRLTELGVKAELSGNYGAAVNAEHHAGKASGLYVDKTEDVTPTRASLRDELASLLGPDIADSIMDKRQNQDSPEDA